MPRKKKLIADRVWVIKGTHILLKDVDENNLPKNAESITQRTYKRRQPVWVIKNTAILLKGVDENNPPQNAECITRWSFGERKALVWVIKGTGILLKDVDENNPPQNAEHITRITYKRRQPVWVIKDTLILLKDVDENNPPKDAKCITRWSYERRKASAVWVIKDTLILLKDVDENNPPKDAECITKNAYLSRKNNPKGGIKKSTLSLFGGMDENNSLTDNFNDYTNSMGVSDSESGVIGFQKNDANDHRYAEEEECHQKRKYEETHAEWDFLALLDNEPVESIKKNKINQVTIKDNGFAFWSPALAPVQETFSFNNDLNISCDTSDNANKKQDNEDLDDWNLDFLN